MPRHKRGRWAASEPDRVRAKVEALFSRSFRFGPAEPGWRLPRPCDMHPEHDWKVAELQTMKAELNEVKSRLSDKDIVTWHEHTCSTNRAGLVVATVKRQIRPEMATQAWCKLYELLSMWSVVPAACQKGERPLRSLHLCEAPGAFVAALNHHCVSTAVEQWEWRATTLNPYYEGNPLSRMIADDRFILRTLARWDFGADDTGDLMTPANVDRLLRLTGPVNLVTADGSVDCQGEPAEQERIVSSLHLCEVLCALRALEAGGTLVVKMFTFYESRSVCLLYLLRCSFAEVDVVKPCCSKAGNSEVYVVCRDLTAEPLTSGHLDLPTADGARPLFRREHVPDTFVQQVVQCARFFKSLQEAEISRNLLLYHTEDATVWREVEEVRQATATEFIRRCRLAPIDKELRLTHPLDSRLYTWLQVENKSGTGTYEERTEPRSRHDQLAAVARELASLPARAAAAEMAWRPPPPSADFRSAASRTEGLPPVRLLASKFCSLHLLKLLQRTAAAAEAELVPAPAAAAVRLGPDRDTVLVTLPPRVEPWLCDAAAVTALRAAADLLQPGDTLLVRGLFLFHRLNVSLLHLAAPLFETAALVAPAAGRPAPQVALRSARDPPALAALLDAVLAVLTPRVLSLLPVAQLCVRPAVETLVAYNDRLLQLTVADLLNRAGAGPCTAQAKAGDGS